MKIILILCLFIFINMDLFAVDKKTNKLKYRTFFGKCPSKSAGTLTLKLIKIFENEMSLKAVKQEIIQEKLDEKHFISNYKIKFDPMKNFLIFNFDCPEPLMKVQVFKTGGEDTYNAILVENGELFDPAYEVLLKNERKLDKELPYLALPLKEMDKKIQHDIARMVSQLKRSVRDMLSEIIINNNRELTIIMSIQGRPTSVFIGDDKWSNKIKKLEQIVSYMQSKNKVPAIINLTNTKKVVVKFNH